MRSIRIALVIFLALAYIRGLFVPIMNNNAAHHADIALHMYLTGDYLNLIDRGMDYLDKPHLLFWLAALSYHLFGVTSFAYKFFSFVFALGGIYSTYRLGKMVGGETAGHYAALILASAFAFVLSVNDVRMDAMLVSCMAFATWQLINYLRSYRKGALFLGALGLALGFATKGMVAVALPVMTVLFYLWQQNRIKELLTWRWISLALLTLVLLAPVFYCFYVQFDLHPEKVVRGRSGNSGIMFLLFGQSIQRYTGSGWGSRSSDPFFLIHTFLWAFLPWSVLAVMALGKNIVVWFRTQAKFLKGEELAITASTLFFFLLVSFSRFKNAHYINILFPYIAVLTAQFLQQLSPRYFKVLFWLQFIITALLIIVMATLNIWFFPVTSFWIGAMGFALIGMYLFISRNGDLRSRVVWLSFTTMVFSFGLLNFNFYPKLLHYQSGHVLAQRIKQAGIKPSSVYYVNTGERNYSMDFSLCVLPESITYDSLKKRSGTVYLFTDGPKMDTLRSEKIPFDVVMQVNHYNVTTLKFRFLNPATRSQTLMPHYILQVRSDSDR